MSRTNAKNSNSGNSLVSGLIRKYEELTHTNKIRPYFRRWMSAKGEKSASDHSVDKTGYNTRWYGSCDDIINLDERGFKVPSDFTGDEVIERKQDDYEVLSGGSTHRDRGVKVRGGASTYQDSEFEVSNKNTYRDSEFIVAGNKNNQSTVRGRKSTSRDSERENKSTYKHKESKHNGTVNIDYAETTNKNIRYKVPKDGNINKNQKVLKSESLVNQTVANKPLRNGSTSEERGVKLLSTKDRKWNELSSENIASDNDDVFGYEEKQHKQLTGSTVKPSNFEDTEYKAGIVNGTFRELKTSSGKYLINQNINMGGTESRRDLRESTLKSDPQQAGDYGKRYAGEAQQRSSGSDFQQRSSESDFQQRSSGSDFEQGFSGREIQQRPSESDHQKLSSDRGFQQYSSERDFQKRSLGSDFQQRCSGSDFERDYSGRGFQQHPSGSDLQKLSSDRDLQQHSLDRKFQQRSSESDFQERSSKRDFQQRSLERDFQERSSEKDFQQRFSERDFQQRSSESDFQERSSKREFQQRSSERDFQQRSAEKDFLQRVLGNGVRQRSIERDNSFLQQRSTGNDFQQRSSGSDFKQRSLERNTQNRSPGSDRSLVGDLKQRFSGGDLQQEGNGLQKDSPRDDKLQHFSRADSRLPSLMNAQQLTLESNLKERVSSPRFLQEEQYSSEDDLEEIYAYVDFNYSSVTEVRQLGDLHQRSSQASSQQYSPGADPQKRPCKGDSQQLSGGETQQRSSQVDSQHHSSGADSQKHPQGHSKQHSSGADSQQRPYQGDSQQLSGADSQHRFIKIDSQKYSSATDLHHSHQSSGANSLQRASKTDQPQRYSQGDYEHVIYRKKTKDGSAKTPRYFNQNFPNTTRKPLKSAPSIEDFEEMIYFNDSSVDKNEQKLETPDLVCAEGDAVEVARRRAKEEEERYRRSFIEGLDEDVDVMKLVHKEEKVEEKKKEVEDGKGAKGMEISNNTENIPRLPDAKRDKKEFVVDELVQTERAYIENLELVIKNYMHYLKEQKYQNEMVKAVFSNIESIHEHTQKFLLDLEECKYNYADIGKTFTKHRDLFDKYPKYCRDRKKSHQMITTELKEIVAHLQIKLNDKLGLNSSLLKPIQRMAKYELLLINLNNLLLKDNLNVTSIQNAIIMIQRVARISDTMVTLNMIKRCPYSYNDIGQMILQNEFKLLCPEKVDAMVFLFGKMVIFTEVVMPNQEYNFRYCIPLDALRFNRPKNGLVLVLENFSKNNKAEYMLESKDSRVVNAWTKEINRILWKQLESVKGKVQSENFRASLNHFKSFDKLDKIPRPSKVPTRGKVAKKVEAKKQSPPPEKKTDPKPKNVSTKTPSEPAKSESAAKLSNPVDTSCSGKSADGRRGKATAGGVKLFSAKKSNSEEKAKSVKRSNSVKDLKSKHGVKLVNVRMLDSVDDVRVMSVRRFNSEDDEYFEFAQMSKKEDGKLLSNQKINKKDDGKLKKAKSESKESVKLVTVKKINNEEGIKFSSAKIPDKKEETKLIKHKGINNEQVKLFNDKNYNDESDGNMNKSKKINIDDANQKTQKDFEKMTKKANDETINSTTDKSINKEKITKAKISNNKEAMKFTSSKLISEEVFVKSGLAKSNSEESSNRMIEEEFVKQAYSKNSDTDKSINDGNISKGKKKIVRKKE